MDEKLRQSILRTLAYFDVFGYALTKEEVWRYLLITILLDLRMGESDFCCA